MSKSEELRQLADKFSEGWHEGIKIDAMDVMLLSDAASELETMQAILAQQPATGIEIDFKQTTELLAMFGGEPATVTLMPGDGHRGKGLYAYYTDLPEEGAEFLGEADDEAVPDQQPATGEPEVSRNPFASRCYTMSESHLSGHRLIVGFEKLVDAQDAHEWVARQGRGDFTHPAPSVPSLIEEAISSGHFGVLPMKATTLMCRAGWGASGGELTFQQIGHIYEEMYKARPLPDDA